MMCALVQTCTHARAAVVLRGAAAAARAATPALALALDVDHAPVLPPEPLPSLVPVKQTQFGLLNLCVPPRSGWDCRVQRGATEGSS